MFYTQKNMYAPFTVSWHNALDIKIFFSNTHPTYAYQLIVMFIILYLCLYKNTISVYLYLLDTEKYVRTHQRETPEKLLNFEGLWLLHTVHTDKN